eukprot:6210268-Pleurochrysis_carterae.AAC.2
MLAAHLMDTLGEARKETRAEPYYNTATAATENHAARTPGVSMITIGTAAHMCRPGVEAVEYVGAQHNRGAASLTLLRRAENWETLHESGRRVEGTES